MPDGTQRSPKGTSRAGWVGRSPRRREDAALLTGGGRFTADLPRPAGCLHAAFARAPIAHGRLLGLAAPPVPGVLRVVTGADLGTLGQPAVNGFFPGMPAARFEPLARDRITALGQPLALVLAETAAAARDGAEAVQPEIAELDPGATEPAFAHRWAEGDAAAGFAAAARVVRARIAHARVAPAAMEPRCVLALVEQGRLVVHLSSQTPHRARSDLAAMLGLDAALIRVVAPDIGGSFGAKASLHPEEAAVAWAAWQLRRPVFWQASRSEEFLTATQGRGSVLEGALALDAQGHALALRVTIETPLGHRLPYSAAVPGRNAARCLPGPYRVPAVEIALAARFDHGAAMGIYRGAGRPEAALLMERLMDEGARACGLCPATIRHRNLLTPDALPHRTPTGEVLDSGDYPALLVQALAMGAGLRAARDRRRAAGELVGLGLAVYVEPCGQGFETARLTLRPDGTLLAATGATAQGQGRETAYAQILADALRLPPTAVTVLHGDTDSAPAGIGALASRSTGIGGGALVQAARALEAAALPHAARLLGAPATALAPCPGGFAGAGRRIGWGEIAAAAGGLRVDTRFDAPGEAWSAGALQVLVGIDAETGQVRLESIAWADDIGTVVNPMLAKGQMIGGAAQGLGEALLERLVSAEGQLLSGSFADYALPRAGDMPAAIDLAAPDHPAPARNNPLGAKGVGEAGTIALPAAICNAVAEALATRGIAMDDLDLPLTPERVWRLLNRGDAS
jgi:carbon-monoxide dehydrogenase large subunit